MKKWTLAIATLILALVYWLWTQEAIAPSHALITVEQPSPNQTLSSPIIIKGSARGYWYFEADFPIRLVDSEGSEIAITIARAQDEWMTEDFVPFEAMLEFETDAKKGSLIFDRSNPSGLPENEDQFIVPVRF